MGIDGQESDIPPKSRVDRVVLAGRCLKGEGERECEGEGEERRGRDCGKKRIEVVKSEL